MTTRITFAAMLGASLTLAAPVLAQDEAFALPEQCSDMSLAGMTMSGMEGHDMDMGSGEDHSAMMPDHVRENMEKMAVTMPAMELGMMQPDADIAFACGMIAHHQAAIDMAQVVLDHGADPEMRALAEEIIDVQAAEIAMMTRWLDETAT